MKNNNQLLSAAELEALIQDWGSTPNQSIDKFFPIRTWYLIGTSLFYVIWILFNSHEVAARLAVEPVEILRISKFLYFRGWFLGVVVCIGLYAYWKNFYPALILSCIFLVGSINFIFDLFNVYAEVLADPTPIVTVGLITRFMALWFVYLSVTNSSRLPDVKDRFNILLPFRRAV